MRCLLALAAAALVVVGSALPALAQTGRATGTVRDAQGKGIRGATVRAENPDASIPQITSTTDSKGRWGMIGLKSGDWRFVAEAPGFTEMSTNAPIRATPGPPLVFTLARDLGPIPGALDKNIAQLVGQANTLRDQGRLDQAIAAYQEIRGKNPKLTSINLVMADTYRQRAKQEQDPAARRRLLDRAIESYAEVLKGDAANERARRELEVTRAEASTAPGTNND
jgi:hypothetical protein